jgi:hypothetical protein
MSSETTTSPAGGFLGDPSEAFSPPAAGGCCGSSSAPAAEFEATAGSCCGMAGEASGGCCGGTATAEVGTPGCCQ